MRRLLLLALAVLTGGCALFQGPFRAGGCTGSPNEPVGCTAEITFEGTTYMDRGYVALTDEARAKLTASGTLTTEVEWLPTPDPYAAPMLPVPAEAQFAGASVWAVPGINPALLLLLGPFPQEWDPNLYEMFLAESGSRDPPLELCPYLKLTSKASRPLVCQEQSRAP